MLINGVWIYAFKPILDAFVVYSFNWSAIPLIILLLWLSRTVRTWSKFRTCFSPGSMINASTVHLFPSHYQAFWRKVNQIRSVPELVKTGETSWSISFSCRSRYQSGDFAEGCYGVSPPLSARCRTPLVAWCTLGEPDPSLACPTNLIPVHHSSLGLSNGRIRFLLVLQYETITEAALVMFIILWQDKKRC